MKIEPKKLISIIVPVYNVEKYLGKCIDSILKQTYTNIEIILVDDGSTDNSGKICDSYAKKDKRLIVIHKENGGQSSARNLAIDVAKGDFIGFVDSDDFIINNMYEKLYSNLIKYNADISICSYTEVDESGNVNKPKWKKNENFYKIYNKEEALKELLIDKYITNHSWNKLYKKELFQDIRYPQGKVMEDLAIMYKLFEKSNKIIYENVDLYYYLQRKSSTMNSLSEKLIEDEEQMVETKNQYLSKAYPSLQKEIDIENAKYIKNYYDYILMRRI